MHRPDRSTSRCSRSRARGARRSCAGSPMAALPPRDALLRASVASAPALVCGTGYTGEDGVELLLDPADAPAVWDALLAAGAVPAGLGARDTLRLEACFHLYGNELTEDTRPDRGRARLVLRRGDRLHRRGGGRARTRRHPPRPEAGAVRDRRAGDRAVREPGQRRRRSSPAGRFSPSLERGIGMAYLPADRATPGTRLTIDVRGTERAATVSPQADLLQGGLISTMADASYPDDLHYHAEHDWARIDGDEATLRDHLVRPGLAG